MRPELGLAIESPAQASAGPAPRIPGSGKPSSPCASDRLIRYDEALAALLSHAPPRGPEIVGLDDALGRRLAQAVIAPRDRPARDVSAMDGYAVRGWEPAEPGARRRLIGAAYPGAPFEGVLGPGEAVRVTTGAALPLGAERVIVDERVEVIGGAVQVTAGPGAKPHIRSAGSDFRAGDVLAPAGMRLTAPSLMAVAAAEADQVSVVRRPKVAIISTGDELATGSRPAGPHVIPDSVSPGVSALVRQWGGEVVARRWAGDNQGDLAAVFDEMSDLSDLVVVIGGASGSERDHARASILGHGAASIFQGVALKPGRPTWAACSGRGLIVGLPGNPFAAFVAARLLLAPAIARMAGDAASSALAWRRAPLLGPLAATGPLDLVLAAEVNPAGLRIHASQDSSAQRALAGLIALVRRSAHRPASDAFDLATYLDV